MPNDPGIAALATPNALTTPRMKRSGNLIAIKIAMGIIAALVALLLGLIVLLVIGIETGPVGLMIGLVTATLPVPLYVVLALWIDRYESEPLWMLATAFFWGALVAVFVALLLNTTVGLIFANLTNDIHAGEHFSAGISAPIVEESAKALILFIFFFLKKDEFDGVIDGIVYAAMVGLGFAMTENIQYYGRAMHEAGGGGLTLVFILRGTFSPFSHPLFTSMTGVGLGLARQSGNVLVKVAAPVLGLLVAIVMHTIWNGSAILFGILGFLLTYFVIMVPIFLIMLVVIGLALRREGRLVRDYLLADLQQGLFTQQEYHQLCTIRGRMGASLSALTRNGVSSWRACMRFNQTASELAFLRSRTARGIVSRSQDFHDIEAVYLQTLRDLTQHLRTN